MSTELRAIRPADCKLLFDWANDIEVRANAINPATISWDAHCDWFSRCSVSINCKIFILEHDQLPIGQIRFDRGTNNGWTISYSISNPYRGHGYGKIILRKGIEMMHSYDDLTLIAMVKRSNIPSIRAFLSLGFCETGREEINQEEFIKFQINI